MNNKDKLMPRRVKNHKEEYDLLRLLFYLPEEIPNSWIDETKTLPIEDLLERLRKAMKFFSNYPPDSTFRLKTHYYEDSHEYGLEVTTYRDETPKEIERRIKNNLAAKESAKKAKQLKEEAERKLLAKLKERYEKEEKH